MADTKENKGKTAVAEETETRRAAKEAAREAAEYTRAFEEEFVKQTPTCSARYTIDYALEQLEAVRQEATRFAEVTREKIGAIQSGGPGDVGAQAAGEAMKALIKEHGELYRKLTDFYIGMIAELKAPDDRRQAPNA